MQALLLLNGAAALAMLTFIGNFSKDANLKTLVLGLSHPLSFFSHGTALAVLSAIFAYLSQASGRMGVRRGATRFDFLRWFSRSAVCSCSRAGISQANDVSAAFS